MPTTLPWWRARSLRARVTIAATLVVALGVAAVGAGILAGLRISLVGALDDAARQRARDVAALVDAGQLRRTVPASPADAGAVQVLDARGQVIASSADLDGNERIFPWPLTGPLAAGQPVTLTGLPVGDTAAYRVAAAPARSAGQPVTVLAAVSLDQQTRSLASLAAALATGLPALVALVAATIWVVTGSTLRPVETLRRQVDDVSGTDLHRRVDPPPSRDEVHRLAVTFNALLDRIETAAGAQRRFVADAAHELRSPLTAAITEAETTVRTTDPTTWRAAGLALVADLHRLHRLTEDLLTLARLDHPSRPEPTRPVDLDDIVLAEVDQTRRTIGLPFELTGLTAARVAGDPAALRRAVRNLLDNAARHARRCVAVTLRSEDGAVVLAVADDGPGIPPADRDRVFNRFVRLDQTRDRTTGGSGLGLAIVREIVTAHGGTVRITDPDPTAADGYPGARIEIRLPAL